MGGAERRSMLYLESRCVSLARAMGAQGVQNGGIDGASVAGAVPGGVRELIAENLMVMARDLEACTGNDALMSESDVRRTSRTLPILLAGVDFICSGFGSIQRYDNMFGPSQWNAEDLDDYLVHAARLGRRRRPAHRRPEPRSRGCAAAPPRPCARSTGISGWPTSTTSASSRPSTRRAPRTSPAPT